MKRVEFLPLVLMMLVSVLAGGVSLYWANKDISIEETPQHIQNTENEEWPAGFQFHGTPHSDGRTHGESDLLEEAMKCPDCGCEQGTREVNGVEVSAHTAGQCITNLRQEAEKLREVLRCAKNFSEAMQGEELAANWKPGNALVMLNVAIRAAELPEL